MKNEKAPDSSGYLWYAVFALFGNALNFLFNWYFLKKVSLPEFAIISFFSNVQIFLAIIALALQTTVSKLVIEANNRKIDTSYLNRLFVVVVIVSAFLSLATFGILPLVNSVFKLGLPFTVLAVLPAMFFSFAVLAFFRGIIAGRLQFAWFGFLTFLEPLVKVLLVLFAVPLVGYLNAGLLSLPLALSIAAVASWFLSGIQFDTSKKKSFAILSSFRKFYFYAVIANLGAQIFITLDIFLVKALFTAENAGLYAALSLVSKIVYYLFLLGSGILIPLFLRNAAQKLSSRPLLVGYSAILVGFAIIVLVLFRFIPIEWVSILLGPKTFLLLPLIPFAIGAAVLVSINTLIINHALANERYSYVIVVLAAVALEILLFVIRNKTLLAAIENILTVNLVSLFGLLAITFFSSRKITPPALVEAGVEKDLQPFQKHSARQR